ncbi:MAG: hypothetical protein K2W96_01965 [Gemmataceae bacterium]|nr:hypothetical protein [Gemmataceae bacterium]
MPAGGGLAGKRVCAQVDGGRIRLRKPARKQRGKGKAKTQARRCKGEWRGRRRARGRWRRCGCRWRTWTSTWRRAGWSTGRCGSGAIGSAVRRVVNQRLKGNGLMWLEENAEGMLALRAAALTDRWEEAMERAQRSDCEDGGADWHSPDMPFQLKTGGAIRPPASQPFSCQGVAS